MIGRKNLTWTERRLLLYYELVRVEDQWDANTAAFVDELLAPTARHDCARSFVRLFRSNRTQAIEVADRVKKFLLSRSL